MRISDQALTITSAVEIVGKLKKVSFSGTKVLGVVGDITGVASIVDDGANAYNDFFVTGNWKMGIWETVKGVGTGAFLLLGGEEATLGVKGAELLWNVGTMVIDNNVSKP